MAKPHGSVRIGPISLFALIIILCLAVLSVLSLSTASSELRTSERQAQTTTETYQLERVGQTFLAEVDGALQNGKLPEVLEAWGIQEGTDDAAAAEGGEVIADEGLSGEAAEGTSVVRDELVTSTGSADGTRIDVVFSMPSGRTLTVALGLNPNGTYTLEQWKVTTQWIDDGTGETLWLG